MSATFSQVDHSFNENEDLWAADAVFCWPHLLVIIGKHGGVASDANLAPALVSRFYGIDGCRYALALEALKEDGTLVRVEGGWTTKSYATRHKRARNDSERSKTKREKKNAQVTRNDTGERVTVSRHGKKEDEETKEKTKEEESASQDAGAHDPELPGMGKPKPETKPTAAAIRRSEVDEVFDYWMLKTGINAKGGRSASKNKSRRALITKRLDETYTVEELKRALDVLVASPNHNGTKDGRVFMDVKYALNDNLDGFLAKPVAHSKPIETVLTVVDGATGVSTSAADAFDDMVTARGAS